MNGKAVVVGTDFSVEADHAVAYAARLAAAIGAELRVVHAWNPTGLSADLLLGDLFLDRVLESARSGAEAALSAAAERYACDSLGIVTMFETGPASRVLPRIAQDPRASLLVVGRRGAARLRHIALGSVSERVVRSAACPVLVVPDREESYRLPDRMLVGIDYSSDAREAFRAGLRLSQELKCRQGPLLVHAFQDERALWLASWSEASLSRRNTPDPRALRRWALDVDKRAVECGFEDVEGVAEEALPLAARMSDCDWIVLGLQGRTPLASFLIGSTSQRILEQTDRPVLIVPPRGAPEWEGVE